MSRGDTPPAVIFFSRHVLRVDVRPEFFYSAGYIIALKGKYAGDDDRGDRAKENRKARTKIVSGRSPPDRTENQRASMMGAENALQPAEPPGQASSGRAN